jgi:preprotein translocase subunit YajC
MKAPTIDLEALQATTTETQEGAASTGVPEEGTDQDDSQPGLFDSMLVPMAGCFLVFWFIVIRPEKRQRKAREAMLSALSKGDEVITSGGIHGKVAQVKDDVVTVQVADGVRMRFTLASVQNKVGDEEPKAEDEEATKED